MTKILVIDDDADMRKVLREALTKKSYEVLEAGGGAEGIQLAQNHLPDIIISDVVMDKVDGYKTLATLRLNPATASIPFILMTGMAHYEGLRQGMELGADDYLPKPFTLVQLYASVEARLKKYQALRKEAEQKLAGLRASISAALPDELLTPVKQILSLTELISSGYRHLDLGEIVGLSKDVHKSALQLYRLIENCLVYADLEVLATDPQKLEASRKRKAYTYDVLQPAAVDKARHLQRSADLVLELSLKNVPVAISPNYLRKIAEELLDNGFKFSAAGTPVRVKTVPGETDFSLIVTDQGRGMTREQIAQAGAYTQFDRKLHEQRGTGLGLTIARRLTELHGGSFSLQGQPGRGTTATVNLPKAP